MRKIKREREREREREKEKRPREGLKGGTTRINQFMTYRRINFKTQLLLIIAWQGTSIQAILLYFH